MGNATNNSSGADFGTRVRSAVFWRSGTQIVAQIISWAATLAVIRILDPADYGLYAMTSVVLVFMNFLNGYSFASSLIQSESIEPIRVRQAFGLLIVINFGLAGLQVAIAPLVALYFEQPLVADLLRWQALIYLSTPFLVMPEVLLSRELEFKKQAAVNIMSAVVGAGVGLGFALSGWGVWTLVAAPVSIFWTRAIALNALTRFKIRPSFDFRGAGAMLGFGSTLMLAQLFFIVQSQADIFIAGRALEPHELGLYAEALFITQIFATRFVPPLNEVAFPAYSKLQRDPDAFARSFLKAARLILLVACPFYAGMLVTAGPFVETLFGPKWAAMAPYVAILALAMPVMTLQTLFSPAINALGRPRLNARIAAFGAVLMPLTFLVGIRYGAVGIAWGWVAAYPLLLAFTIIQTRRLIGIDARGLAKAAWPGLSAAVAMGLIVYGAGVMLPPMAAPLRLTILVAVGGASYLALLWLTARSTLEEVLRLVIRRKPPKTVAA